MTHDPILTITLNPALDMSSSTGTVRPGEKLRCAAPVFDAGGGGINVARAIKQLGGDAMAYLTTAGDRGRHVAALLRSEDVPHMTFPMIGETRLSLSVTDEGTGEQFRFVMPGPHWDAGTQDLFCAELAELIAPETHVVLSGSHPHALSDDFALLLTRLVHNQGAALTLDTSGAALTAVTGQRDQRVDVLRLDHTESEALAGRQLVTTEELAGFAAELVASGCTEVAILSHGAAGSVLYSNDGCWHAQTPPVPVRSKVGAGDSFVAGFTLARARGADLPQALQYGVAAASAAVMTDATELCRLDDLGALLPQVQLRRLECRKRELRHPGEASIVCQNDAKTSII